MNVEEGNHLIAEFMGAVPTKVLGTETWDIPNMDGLQFVLFYNSSWDWLMPVVEKIENIEVRGMYTVIIKQQYCSITFQDETDTLLYETTAQESSSKIDAVWQTVVKFIKNKNENTSSLQS